MRKYWYRRVLIMILAFTVSVGGSYYLIENRQQMLEQEVNAQASQELLIPGGMPIGIYLETEGVLVLGTDAVTAEDGLNYEPAAHLVKEGDYIVAVEGREISDKNDLIRTLNDLEKDEVVLKIRRHEQMIDVRVGTVKCGAREYKLGIWVRDNAQGLGTVTFLNANSQFGALGHGIHDVDTNELLEISDGVLYTTSIRDIQKGENGLPGGMEGVIVYNNYNVLGSIDRNTDRGIFGTVDRVEALFANMEPMPAASPDEVETGKAYIRCAVTDSVEEYEIQITTVDTREKEANKRLVIQVTDEKLLNLTGGIVQGMSGSPIIQNHKIVGAVTHVFVNDPTKGYGILVESMLEEM